MKKITNLFIVCYVTLFPLWMGTGGYSNIQEEKNGFLWIFIRLFLMTFGLEACIIMALYRDELKEVIIARKNILILTLAFAVNMIVAWLINGKDTSFLYGTDGRMFGMFLWLSVLLLFVIFMNTAEKSFELEVMMILTLIIVSFIAYLNFLGFNVFYASSIDIRRSAHISTIGNIDLLAGYIGMTVSYAIGKLIFDANKNHKIFYSLAVFAASCALISSNSDTGYLIFGIVFLVLPFFIKEGIQVGCYLLSVIIFAVSGLFMKCSMKIMGEDKCRILYGLSKIHVNTIICCCTIVICLVGMWFLTFKNRNCKPIKAMIYIMRGAVITIMTGMVSVIGSANVAPFKTSVQERLGILTEYVVFTNYWGTGRGILWKSAVDIFKGLPVLQKFFGFGVAGYYKASQGYLSQEIYEQLWKNSKIVDPHNTFLQSLINFGIIGTVLYIAILVYFIVIFVRKAKEDREFYAFVLVIIAYIAQASVNYFHFFQEPLFFIVMAYGLAQVKKIDEHL